MLGALVRLAARDGADDDLATLPVCHQLAGLARGVAISLRDLSADVDALVAGALWIEVKTFPSQRRCRGFATSLARSTRASVLRLPKPTRQRTGGEREVPVDPAALLPWGDCAASPTNPAETARQDLLHLLTWAGTTGHLSNDDIRLLLDLVDAGTERRPTSTHEHRNATITCPPWCGISFSQHVAELEDGDRTIVHRADDVTMPNLDGRASVGIALETSLDGTPADGEAILDIDGTLFNSERARAVAERVLSMVELLDC